jgi:DNA-binding response OmpR family regulator
MLLKKIVIAEDDDAIAHMVNMALGDAGFLCLRARDGEEALKLVKGHDPDLLVLDVMMPRVDGFEVAKRLKADVMWSRTPILMLTALVGIDNQVQGLEAGADAYMGKPFDLREFGARVKAMIRSARRERDRNPTTNLPGSRAIDEELERALKGGTPTGVIHVDLLNFDAYADAVGIARSEDTVRALGQLLLEQARAITGGGAFVGHVGGSDFIAAVAREHAEALARAVEAAFTAAVASGTAFAPVPAPPGGEAQPIALVMALATTEGLTLNGGPDELGRRLGRAMKQAKAAGKTGHVVWSA